MENETPENNEEETSEESIEQPDELVKSKEYGENQKIRAEKAEKELKKLKADKPDKPETSKNEEQSDEPDYGKLAFLNSKGIDNPDDQKVVTDEATRLKLPVTDILGMKHIKSQLKEAKTQREAEGGMPGDSKGKSSGSKGSVDHWVNKKDKKGNFVPVPAELGTELANKVIDARVKQEKDGKMFSDELF